MRHLILLIWARRSLVVCDVNTCLYMTYHHLQSIVTSESCLEPQFLPFQKTSLDFLKMTKVDCEDCYEKFTSKKLYINHVKSKSCSKTKLKSRQRAGQETATQGAKRVRLEGETLFTLICDALSRNLRLPPSGVSYSNFIPVLCPIC